MTGTIPADSVLDDCLNALHLLALWLCETCIMKRGLKQTEMLTCFDSQQSLLIPCQQLQQFLFVFYQTSPPLSLLPLSPSLSVCGCVMLDVCWDSASFPRRLQQCVLCSITATAQILTERRQFIMDANRSSAIPSDSQHHMLSCSHSSSVIMSD